jgi:hypothetical protein
MYLYNFPDLKIGELLGPVSDRARWLTITVPLNSHAPLVETFSLQGASEAVIKAMDAIASAIARRSYTPPTWPYSASCANSASGCY